MNVLRPLSDNKVYRIHFCALKSVLASCNFGSHCAHSDFWRKLLWTALHTTLFSPLCDSTLNKVCLGGAATRCELNEYDHRSSNSTVINFSLWDMLKDLILGHNNTASKSLMNCHNSRPMSNIFQCCKMCGPRMFSCVQGDYLFAYMCCKD